MKGKSKAGTVLDCSRISCQISCPISGQLSKRREQNVMKRTKPGCKSACLAGVQLTVPELLFSLPPCPLILGIHTFILVLSLIFEFYVFGHRGYRFKSKVRSLDHFEELLMSGLALPFVLLDCFLPFPTWYKRLHAAGKSDGAARVLPRGPGLPDDIVLRSSYHNSLLFSFLFSHTGISEGQKWSWLTISQAPHIPKHLLRRSGAGCSLTSPVLRTKEE